MWRDVWFLAGAVGVDPRELTLRQLLLMAEGHGRDAWGRLSVLLALTANAHRDPKKGRAFKPADFNPFSQKGKEPGEVVQVNRENIGLFKEAFTTGKGVQT